MLRHRRTSGRLSVPLCAALVIASQVTASAQKPAASADYLQEALVFEQIRSRVRFESDGTGTRELYMRVRTQNEGGVEQFGQLVFGYNSANERTEVSSVRVRKPDGTVILTPPEAVQDLSSPVERIAPIYTDYRQKHVTVQSLRPGDVLEVTVLTTVHTALASGQFWTDHDFEDDAVVLDEQFDIDVPSGRRVIVKTRPGLEGSPKEANGRRVYHWTSSQLKGASERKAENDAKIKNDRRPADEPEPAAIRLTTFQTWDDVGRWYAALETPQRVPTAEVRKKATELIAGRTTDLEKIESLYEFVATNFRYVSLSLGAGRYQPRSSSAVLQEQYGDCKDKHTLLASLIDAAGLKASAVLINTAVKIDPEFPSPAQFNHVITLTRAGNEDVWLDTTTEVAPFRLLMNALRNKQGLVVDTAKPRLERTPANPPMKSLVSQAVEGTLESGGRLTAHVRMTVRGDFGFVMRMIFRRAPPARWKEVLDEFVKAGGNTGDLSNWKVSDPAALHDPFSVEFDLAVPRYADWTAKRITVALPLTASPLFPTGGVDDSADATEPVDLGAAPTDVSYSLRMTLPAGVTARAPLSVKQARDYGAYRGDYAVKDNILTAERVMTVLASEVPADRRQDVAAFLKVVAGDGAQKLSLETSSAITPSTTAPGLTAAQLNRSGYDALQAGNYAEAVTLLKRVVELEPKDKVAWNNLGRAYTGLRQTDLAIDAYQKQVAVNPYDQYAYNNLGRAYVVAREYDKAEAAFLKQLEVNPLDRYTPSNLGSLYLTRRNYQRAAELFDKAITLDPENAWVHTQAGKAYLNLKQVDTAMNAFDRAVEKAPNPSTWNNVAYELSLHGLHLDRAQQYAESAVSSATAASRTFEISRGDAASLGMIRSLAMYWDTLGWVHFARGDFAKALPYVEMAWKLAQHGEVGDHLAQIHEKQGRREEAIRNYALAMSASEPSADARGRLEALLTDGRTVTSVVDSTRKGLSEMRTFKVTPKAAANATAEFLVLFSPPGTVDAVRFISGDESLRPLTDAIRAASFGRMFPDDAPAKILRRGLLGCAPSSGCVMTLILPDDAEPVK